VRGASKLHLVKTVYTAFHLSCEYVWRKLTSCRPTQPLALWKAMAEPQVTQAAPDKTTRALESTGDVTDNSIAEKAGKPDSV
jgi:hypothetical protein